MNAGGQAKIKVKPGQPLDFLRALRSIPAAVGRGAPVWNRGEPMPLRPYIRRRALALVRVLRLRVDNKTMLWPVHAYGRGIGLEQLAAEAGYSRSSGVRGLRELEALGIVETEMRRPMRNRYKINEAAMIKLAQAHMTATGACWDEVDAGESEDQGPADRPPRWTAKLATGNGVSTGQVWELMQAVVAAVYGGEVDPREYGNIGRSVMRIWALRDRPAPADFALDLAVLSQAARSAPGAPWNDIRGEVRGRNHGKDRSRSLAELLRPAPFSDRLQAARGYAMEIQELQARSAQLRALESRKTAGEGPLATRDERDGSYDWRAALVEHDRAVTSRFVRPAAAAVGRPRPGATLVDQPPQPHALQASWDAALAAVVAGKAAGWMTARTLLCDARVTAGDVARLTVSFDGDPRALPESVLESLCRELGRDVELVGEAREPPG
jgi:hypothetical protein